MALLLGKQLVVLLFVSLAVGKYGKITVECLLNCVIAEAFVYLYCDTRVHRTTLLLLCTTVDIIVV